MSIATKNKKRTSKKKHEKKHSLNSIILLLEKSAIGRRMLFLRRIYIMNANPCQTHVSSFDINKAITLKRFFSKIKITASARLVLRCLIDFYNPKKGLVYPGQKTIAECTDLSLRSVNSAVDELRKKGVILTSGSAGERLKYFFSAKFFDLLEIAQHNAISAQAPHAISAQHGTNNHEQNKKHPNNKLLNFEPRHISIETTKKYLTDQKNIQSGSPLDYTYNEAIDYLNSLLPELQNSFFAKELRKKWKISFPKTPSSPYTNTTQSGDNLSLG